MGKDEIFQIFKDFQAHKTGYLTLDEFSQRLTCWKEIKKLVEKPQRTLKTEASTDFPVASKSIISKPRPIFKKRPITAAVKQYDSSSIIEVKSEMMIQPIVK